MFDLRYLRVAVIRRVTARALQVILGEHPYQIVWLPRRCVQDGDGYQAGERDLLLGVEAWIVAKNKLPYDE